MQRRARARASGVWCGAGGRAAGSAVAMRARGSSAAGVARAWWRRAAASSDAGEREQAAQASGSRRRGRGAGGVGDWRPAAGGVGGERNVREEGRVRVDPTAVTVLHESQILEGDGEKSFGRCIDFPAASGRRPRPTGDWDFTVCGPVG